MLVVAIDTSGRNGSVALCRAENAKLEILGLSPLEGGTYSARLIPVIAELLQQHRLQQSHMDGLVVVSGPGSFTGLRVGLATVKGLCEILGKPLAAVSMLEALAVTYGAPGETIRAVLDGGRSEIYVGEFVLRDGRAEAGEKSIQKLHEFAEAASQGTGRILTPDQRVADALREAGIEVEQVKALDAGDIAGIGVAKLLRGEVSDPATLDVDYIRRSDAEIFSSPRR